LSFENFPENYMGYRVNHFEDVLYMVWETFYWGWENVNWGKFIQALGKWSGGERSAKYIQLYENYSGC
jgi:hypothetical protein